ncbi:uncharacterized protein [Euphorbia lathyris]|uniref:uncharacterized protein n=1 Tax=Euphorbia lathyris TaxID=212925 RepID=UPI0033135DA4
MEPYSRFVGTAARYYRAFFVVHIRPPRRGFAAAAETGSSAGDHSSDNPKPSAPTGEPEETRDHYEPKMGKREIDKETEHIPPKKATEPFVQPRAPYGTSPKLESSGVNNPVEPQIQQKREKSSTTSTAVLEEVAYAGLDGSPWLEEKEKKQEDEKDDNEYYKHHKPSPLSEIEIADTKKPITRVTDEIADVKWKDVIGWLSEQVDTAEEALERASIRDAIGAGNTHNRRGGDSLSRFFTGTGTNMVPVVRYGAGSGNGIPAPRGSPYP